MLAVKLGTGVSWQWYVLIGSLTTLAIGWAAGRMLPFEAPPAASAAR
jgi:hypothetical protein